ncbi:MAG: HNH endonuclease [Candidatus Moranbacteria bacterium]|nr:HNH endonuclease [Candidatus Moranbacteria bacterium]
MTTEDRSAYHKAYRAAHKAEIAAYDAANKMRKAEQKKAYRAVNKDKIAARQKAWRSSNKEEILARKKEYREAHGQQISTYGKAWQQSNKEAHKEACKRAWHKRRALKQQSGGTLSKGLPEKLYQLQRGKCPCCRQPLGKDFHMDHIMPLALGGSNEDSNIQLLRKTCNLQKQAKHPVDFMQSRGFLF